MQVDIIDPIAMRCASHLHISSSLPLQINVLMLTCFPCSSVRSTNVYEEKSLGVYRDDEEEEYEEEDFEREVQGSRMMVWSQYLAMHARKQLAFGTSPPPPFSISCAGWIDCLYSYL